MNTQWHKFILLANLAATLYLVGLIWCVQVAHYPLFAQVGTAGFVAYESAHRGLISLVVGPPMLLEAATTVVLLIYRPASMNWSAALLGLILLAVIWLSTLFLQIPQHDRLSGGFDAAAHHLLVLTNWVRTVAWSLRGGLMLWVTAKMMG